MSADCRKDSREDAARQPAKGVARGDSQQRVGILRNPNRAPLPPPRRATLMGKWPRLRSSRRAAPATLLSAAQALAGESGAASDAPVNSPENAPALAIPGSAQQPRPAGGVNAAGTDTDHGANRGAAAPKIDIARLMGEVADLGERKSKRSRFGAGICAASHPRRAAGSDGIADETAVTPEGSHAFVFSPTVQGDDGAQVVLRPSDDPPPPGPRHRVSAWVLAGLAVLAMGIWLGN